MSMSFRNVDGKSVLEENVGLGRVIEPSLLPLAGIKLQIFSPFQIFRCTIQ